MTVSAASVVGGGVGESKGNGRTLVVGATGFIGRFLAESSLEMGRPTFILVRPGPLPLSKTKIVKSLQDKGAIMLLGQINDKVGMVKLLKEEEIEVVISAVGGEKVCDQFPLIQAIKEVPTVKRFLPSEFGHDVDRANPVEPGLRMYREKRGVRRAIEEAGLPYTYICCNSIASWPYFDNNHPSEVTPPTDRFQIYGDGSVKAYFVAGNDIGKFTMKTVDDPRTLNKMVHFRPPCNYLNINELASLWEKKIGKTLPRVTVSEEDLLAAAAKNVIPASVVASFTHDIFIQGCQVCFSVDGANEVEIEELYPEDTYITMDECFDQYLINDDPKSSDLEITMTIKATATPTANKTAEHNKTSTPIYNDTPNELHLLPINENTICETQFMNNDNTTHKDKPRIGIDSGTDSGTGTDHLGDIAAVVGDPEVEDHHLDHHQDLGSPESQSSASSVYGS